MAVDEGRAEEDVIRAKMIEHDELVGSLLKKLEELGRRGQHDHHLHHRQRQRTDALAGWRVCALPRREGHDLGGWRAGPCLVQWPGKIKPGSVSNGIQNHEDLFATLAAAAGLPNLKEELLAGRKMGDMTYKAHLDGYNNMAHWMDCDANKSARREIFYYDETDLMALRVDGWKMHIGVKHHGSWFDEKSYPSVPYVVNLLMDPMEKMTPDSEEWGYIGKKFLAQKLWAPTAATPFLATHLKSLIEYPAQPGRRHLEHEKGDRGRYEENGYA